jgi:hypothetical protein
LPNGWGKKYRVTADTVDIEIADKYQLGKVKQTNDINGNNAEDIETKKETSNGETQ